MQKICRLFFVLFLLVPLFTQAQKASEFNFSKQGSWSFKSNINGNRAEFAALTKNVAVVAEWFHQNIPIMTNPKGFDLSAVSWGIWDNRYKKRNCNYSIRCELNFGFQMFLTSGGKWTVEPPSYEFDINNTETGHGTNFNFNGFDETKDNASLEVSMNKTAGELNDLFQVFPFEKEIVPGVSLYGDGQLIVFNPDRPPFWIPVTLKELADITLAYYTAFKSKEMGEIMLDQLKKELAELTDEELSAPAYQGDPKHFVLNANGRKEGLQIMRFNPDYWDRSLPASAIQFMTLWNPRMSEVEMDEFYKNNGYKHFGQQIISSMNWNGLAGLISRKK
ncbi:MAG: hypothetical protein Q7U54_00545 [Bacteroidales bacterium]|nr:hypothetical protein [Bacteroidales bacterium]